MNYAVIFFLRACSTRRAFKIAFACLAALAMLQMLSDTILLNDDPVDLIHKRNLKAVQLLTERFNWQNWGLGELGEAPFSRCAEKRCFAFKPFRLVQRPLEKSDAVLVHLPNLFYLSQYAKHKRNRRQLWLLYTMESQRRSFCSLFYTPADLDDVFNITATFKHDSDLLADYKEFTSWRTITASLAYVNAFKKFRSESTNIATSIAQKISASMSTSRALLTAPAAAAASKRSSQKTQQPFIFWFVSHCHTPSRRESYVRELLQHVDVDVYGACSSLYPGHAKSDPCSKPAISDTNKCNIDLYNSYKFYLAFENSQCNDYISEKYWKIYSPERLFAAHVVPVVRGAHDTQYKRLTSTSRHSSPLAYINADAFKTPRHLAEFLIYLNGNETAYAAYLTWKVDVADDIAEHVESSESKSNTRTAYETPRSDLSPFCDVCAKLHNETYLSEQRASVSVSKWLDPAHECWDKGEYWTVFEWFAKLFGYCI